VYERDKDYLFAIPADRDNFFSHAMRSCIVDYILRRMSFSTNKDDALNCGIKRLLADGTYLAAYPLHEGSWQPESKMSMRRLLWSNWANWRASFKMQPLDYIRLYFGEKIGFYFAWLGYYTYWLMPASLCGLLIFIYGILTIDRDIISREACDATNNFTMCPMCNLHCGYWSYHQICYHTRVTHAFDNELTFFFAIFMSLWGTLYLEFWKREQASIQFRWNLTNFQEEEEPPRPEYLARLARSGYRKNHPIFGENQPYIPYWRRQCLCAICVVIGVVFYRMSILAALYLTDNPLIYRNAVIVVSISAAIINLILICIINIVRICIFAWLFQTAIFYNNKIRNSCKTVSCLLQSITYYFLLYV
jgi:anoctamin-1